MKVATSVRLEITMSVRQSVTSITSLSLVGVTAAVSTADFHEYTSYMDPFTCAVHARLVRNSILPYLISPYERDTTPTPVPSDSLPSFNPAMLARNIRLKVSTVDRLSPNEFFQTIALSRCFDNNVFPCTIYRILCIKVIFSSRIIRHSVRLFLLK